MHVINVTTKFLSFHQEKKIKFQNRANLFYFSLTITQNKICTLSLYPEYPPCLGGFQLICAVSPLNTVTERLDGGSGARNRRKNYHSETNDSRIVTTERTCCDGSVPGQEVIESRVSVVELK